MRNRLDQETSPYLLQHQDNPVHWQPWGPEALAQAAAENKPILLSVGYAACHWCHVMAHESFETEATAEVMNELFVNIKVDREERPDIDTIYQTALAMLGQHGGWPLTMFLSPDGRPFWGGTYFPPEPAYGRPGFVQVLRHVAEVYRQRPDDIAKNANAITEALGAMAAPKDSDGPDLTPDLLDRVADHILGQVDAEFGGLAGAPKFPQTHILELLWRAGNRTGNAKFRDAVTLSLDQMCQGGIYDHLGGGFARYATDERWLIPHFEKMLYDNAMLIDLLTLAWQATGNPLYRIRVAETAEWVLREMTTQEGGFAASQDADSEGEEGRFYVWTEAEIDRLLAGDAAAFKAVYGVTADGNWDGKAILNRSHHLALGNDRTEAELTRLRNILFVERDLRVHPGWDDKVLADWNGLMIAALAQATRVFDQPHWLAAATRAFHFVYETMSEGDRLRHSYRTGRARHEGMLDDYANMARAALALHEVVGDPAYLKRAEAWTAALNDQFWDPRHGGYFLTAADAETLITRTRSIADNATPPGNGTMIGVLTRLHLLTGRAAYGRQADALIAGFSGELVRNLFANATYLNQVDLAMQPLRIVVIGGTEDQVADNMVAEVFRAPLPNRVFQRVAPGVTLADDHPAAEAVRQHQGPAAFVCVGQTCSLPLDSAGSLKAALTEV